MANIRLVDVTVHIDESLGAAERAELEQRLRSLPGVISVHMPADKPHLCVVEYDPDSTHSKKILEAVLGQHLHAELIGL